MANDPSTYSGLVTSVANWLNRTDLSTTEIPEAIALAERRFQRLVFCPEREVNTTLTATAATVALPSDFWGMKSVYADLATKIVLQQVTREQLDALFPSTTTGNVSYFAIEGENMLLGPTPSDSTDLIMTYYQTIPALNSSDTTNWLLTDHPDLYMWGALAELHVLLRDTEGMQIFEAKMRNVLDDVNRSGRDRHFAGPLYATTQIPNVRNVQA